MSVARIVRKLCANGHCDDDLIDEANALIEGHVRNTECEEDSIVGSGSADDSAGDGFDALKIMNRISPEAVTHCLKVSPEPEFELFPIFVRPV